MPRFHHTLRLLRWPTLVVAALLASSPARTQVRGSVADAGGAPQRGVLVELWSPTAVLGATRTDDAGRFSFDAARSRGAVRLVASRTGLRRTAVPLAAGDGFLVLRMRSDAVALGRVAVRSRRQRLCPAREQPAARALWRAMASRYDPDAYRLGRGSHTLQVDEEVPLDGLVPPEPPYARPGVLLLPGTSTDSLHWWSWQGFDETGPAGQPRILQAGYGHGIVESFDPAYASWRYEDVGAGNAIHWVTPEFASMHGFRVLSAAEGTTVLAFCPAAVPRGRPAIEGTLTIAPDTTLVQATWRFRTASPHEDAGGEAEFFPPGPGMPVRALLPRTDRFWRRAGGGRYFQRWRRYQGWIFSEDAAVPIFTGPGLP